MLFRSAFYNYGPDKPAPEFQIYPWLRTVDMRWYFFNGVWQTPNSTWLPGNHRWEEFAAEADIWSFDGGDGSNPAINPPTAISGAMWELDTNYNGRSPMSPGIIASSVPAKTLGYGENFGVGTYKQIGSDVAAHQQIGRASCRERV